MFRLHYGEKPEAEKIQTVKKIRLERFNVYVGTAFPESECLLESLYIKYKLLRQSINSTV